MVMIWMSINSGMAVRHCNHILLYILTIRTQLLNMPSAPIKIWAHWGAPNPWKVCMILEALELPYTLQYLEFSEVKNEGYLLLTPNGRLPAMVDLNTGLTLWEVGLVVPYAYCSIDCLIVFSVWCYHPVYRRSV